MNILPLLIIGVGSIAIATFLWWLSKKFGGKQKEIVIKKQPNSEGTPFLDVRHTPQGVKGIHIGMNDQAEPMREKEVIDLTAVTQDLVILETERARARTEEARAQTAQACKEIAQADLSPFTRDQMLRKINPDPPLPTIQKRRPSKARLLDPDDIVGIV